MRDSLDLCVNMEIAPLAQVTERLMLTEPVHVTEGREETIAMFLLLEPLPSKPKLLEGIVMMGMDIPIVTVMLLLEMSS
jgi:hypothetical protein